jgi:hypothetical protein
MTSTRFLAGLAACAALLLTLAGGGAWALHRWQHDIVVYLMFGGAVVYAAAAWLTLKHAAGLSLAARRRALVIVLATAVLARGLLVLEPPVSTDINRYVWDGRVQAAGINPYRYRPADAPVAFLRDARVYPEINRAATAVTIYPPMAQMIFLGATRIADSVTGVKAAMVGFDFVTLGALLALLKSRRLPTSRLLLYAWHPLPLFEFAGSGHIDAAAIALMMLACVAAEWHRPLAAGALLGGAFAVKYFPIVVVPALYRRWGWRLPAAFAAVVVAVYLPYASVGSKVLGFLPGYVNDEGLTAGTGFFLLAALRELLPLPSWATVAYVLAGAGVLAALAWRALRRPGGGISMPAALALMAVFTMWLSPHLPWYFTWIMPFLCFQPSWALIYLASAAPLLYQIVWDPGMVWLQATLYAPCALIFAIELWSGLNRPMREPTDDGSLESRHAG